MTRPNKIRAQDLTINFKLSCWRIVNLCYQHSDLQEVSRWEMGRTIFQLNLKSASMILLKGELHKFQGQDSINQRLKSALMS